MSESELEFLELIKGLLLGFFKDNYLNMREEQILSLANYLFLNIRKNVEDRIERKVTNEQQS